MVNSKSSTPCIMSSLRIYIYFSERSYSIHSKSCISSKTLHKNTDLLYPDGLDVHKSFHAIMRKFATVARFFYTAEWQPGVRLDYSIYKNTPYLQTFCDCFREFNISCP